MLTLSFEKPRHRRGFFVLLQGVFVQSIMPVIMSGNGRHLIQ